MVAYYIEEPVEQERNDIFFIKETKKFDFIVTRILQTTLK